MYENKSFCTTRNNSIVYVQLHQYIALHDIIIYNYYVYYECLLYIISIITRV